VASAAPFSRPQVAPLGAEVGPAASPHHSYLCRRPPYKRFRNLPSRIPTCDSRINPPRDRRI